MVSATASRETDRPPQLTHLNEGAPFGLTGPPCERARGARPRAARMAARRGVKLRISET
jgi:hypothetical protein